MDEKLDYQFANNAKSLWKAHQLFNKKKKKNWEYSWVAVQQYIYEVN